MSSKQNKIRILHLSTHNENCGIGKYQEMYVKEMDSSDEVENAFFELSPNQIKLMNKHDYSDAFELLDQKLKDFDILHIQHEYSFYRTDELERAINVSKSQNKKSIVTIHTSANVGNKKARLKGLGPRSFAYFAKAIIQERRFFKRFINPLKQANLILVHNEVTKQSLVDRGISADIIHKIAIPVPVVKHSSQSDEIKKNLKVKSGDIVYATVGFLHRYKGVKQAIKALEYLPENYKLAIVGGLHPETDDIAIYDKIADLIVSLSLKDRVYITGYVSDDNRMNALIRECDMCVYPYDKEYYSNVSSAALNNAFANHSPVVAYPTESFKEANSKVPALNLTQSFSYYELARTIQQIDLRQSKIMSEKYAMSFSYSNLSPELISIYRDLINS